MEGPKNRIQLTAQTPRPKYPEQRGKHNRTLYNSRRWRAWRQIQMERLALAQWDNVEDLPAPVQAQVLALAPICTICLDLVRQGAYETVEQGKTLDHILCLNPADWKDTLKGIFGEAFDPSNVQPLCYKHHAKKGSRDDRYQKKHMP